MIDWLRRRQTEPTAKDEQALALPPVDEDLRERLRARSMDTTEAETSVAMELLSELACCEPAFVDSRVRYVEIQIDLNTWAALVRYRRDGRPTPTEIDWRIRESMLPDDLFDADRHLIVEHQQREADRFEAMGMQWPRLEGRPGEAA